MVIHGSSLSRHRRTEKGPAIADRGKLAERVSGRCCLVAAGPYGLMGTIFRRARKSAFALFAASGTTKSSLTSSMKIFCRSLGVLGGEIEQVGVFVGMG
jgi:hypothetical protein